MYREVIEHPWSIPTEIKQHLDLTHGRDRGRLYRIAPADPAWRRRSSVALGRATTAELVATLAHPNGWHRDTATRLLYERRDRAATPALAALLRAAPSPVAQLHALAALDGLGALDAAAVTLTLSAADPVVRERGILLVEKLAALPPALAEKLAALADDPAPRVRFQLAFTVPTLLAAAAGENPALTRAAVRLAARDHGDPWIGAALLSSPPQIIARVLLPAFQRDRALAKAAAGFFAKLLETAVAVAPAADRAALIAWVAQPEPSALWLRALGDGLRRAGVSFADADPAHTLREVFAAAARTAPDASAALAARREAIDLLGVATWVQAREPLVACLAPAQPEAIQVAAVATLAAFAEPAVAAELLRHWRYAPAAKQAVLAALLRRDERALALLDAIAAGKLAATELSAAQVQTLAGHTAAAVATRARTVLAGVIPPSRADVAATFQAATTAAGDAARGQAHYAARCQICHRAGDAGLALGPDLVTVKNRGRDALLAAILDPHREVAPQYIAYDVATKDGQAYTGLIVRDDATGLGLRVMGGAEIALARAAVKGSTSSGRSLMPEGLEAGMSVQDMADLLTFIEELR
jgi:putative heme-binding domain-containing protein